jgi:hypothetical protein
MQPPPLSGRPQIIKEYFLAAQDSIEELNRTVAGAIANGWQPFGSPFTSIETIYDTRIAFLANVQQSVAVEGEHHKFYQALVIYG